MSGTVVWGQLGADFKYLGLILDPCAWGKGESLSPKVSPVSKCKLLSHAQLFATPWTVAHQAPLSMRFSRQGYWSGLPFPSPGDLPDLGIEPGSPALQADSLPTELQGKPEIEPRSPTLQADSLPAEPQEKPQGQSKSTTNLDGSQHLEAGSQLELGSQQGWSCFTGAHGESGSGVQAQERPCTCPEAAPATCSPCPSTASP